MRNSRVVLVMLLIGGTVAGGCQSNSATTIAEYRPKQALTEHKSPASEVLVLVRWTPIVPAAATTQARKATARPARQMPVELEQVYVPRGRTVGFRREDGQLIAFADADSKPLPEAHYEWKTLAGYPGAESQDMHRRFNQIVGTVAVVTVVAGIVAVVLWAIHVNRHSLADDIFNDGN
jgi:hypothetical protein